MTVTIDEGVDRDQVISRYMSFAKVMDLLTNEKAFLPSVDALKGDLQGDHLEGAFPSLVEFVLSGGAAKLSHLVNQVLPRTLGVNKSEIPKLPSPAPLPTVFGEIEITGDRDLSSICKTLACWVDVQCWHRNDAESMAMWKIYGGAEPSLAIRSTVRNLSNSMLPNGNERVHLKNIQYYNSLEPADFFVDDFSSVASKEIAYDYEHELRVIAYTPSDKQHLHQDRQAKGRYISVNLEELISDIVISPNAPNWFFDLARTLIIEKLDVPVKRSALTPNRGQF
ncbi:hypothetical protein [Thalassospira lucentensis]|uniref:hypothetical protein n=1 Tax=Thalassospira lucentensis TaxID=168935 RepID=UPI003AA8C364